MTLYHKTIKNAISRGFTVVELLIVIVVIGILAAISIVAYNGIQQKATTASNHSAIRNYIQAFQLMKTETGSLPTANSCLGPSGAYAGGTCSFSGQNGTVNETTNSQLAKYGLTTQPPIKQGSENNVLMIYTPSFFGEPALLYRLTSNQDCTAAKGRFYVEGSSAWVDNRSYSSRNASVTTCWMSLRDL